MLNWGGRGCKLHEGEVFLSIVLVLVSFINVILVYGMRGLVFTWFPFYQSIVSLCDSIRCLLCAGYCQPLSPLKTHPPLATDLSYMPQSLVNVVNGMNCWCSREHSWENTNCSICPFPHWRKYAFFFQTKGYNRSFGNEHICLLTMKMISLVICLYKVMDNSVLIDFSNRYPYCISTAIMFKYNLKQMTFDMTFWQSIDSSIITCNCNKLLNKEIYYLRYISL